MINSRQKGKRGEREFVHFLRDRGEVARRGVQFAGGPESPDVICETLPTIHFEIKFAKRVDITAAMLQACNDCPQGKFRVVAWKETGKRAPWMATMKADEFCELFNNVSDVKDNLKFFLTKNRDLLVTLLADQWHDLIKTMRAL